MYFAADIYHTKGKRRKGVVSLNTFCVLSNIKSKRLWPPLDKCLTFCLHTCSSPGAFCWPRQAWLQAVLNPGWVYISLSFQRSRIVSCCPQHLTRLVDIPATKGKGTIMLESRRGASSSKEDETGKNYVGAMFVMLQQTQITFNSTHKESIRQTQNKKNVLG